MTAAELVALTEPGVYPDLPEADYHAQQHALSASGARRLLPPSCPALFDYWRREGQGPKAAFDLGHAAHRVVLGVGLDVHVIDAEDWRGKAARQERDEAYAAGEVPLLIADWQRVHAMAEALIAHPYAGVLLDPEHGRPEQSLFWTDEGTGVMRRARLDWLPDPHSGRAILVDYKTAKSAEPDRFGRALWDYGYVQQAPWYLDGAIALDLVGPDAAFVFVVQEHDPPYLVTVCEPDERAMRVGRLRNRQAIETYAECTAVGEWPGYTSDVVAISLPPWIERQYEEEYM